MLKVTQNVRNLHYHENVFSKNVNIIFHELLGYYTRVHSFPDCNNQPPVLIWNAPGVDLKCTLAQSRVDCCLKQKIDLYQPVGDVFMYSVLIVARLKLLMLGYFNKQYCHMQN